MLRRNYMTNQNQQPPATPRPSFGFELELPQLPSIPPEENPAVKALEKMMEILNAATNGSDQELNEAVTRLHPAPPGNWRSGWSSCNATAPGSAWSLVTSRRRSARRKCPAPPPGSRAPLPREPGPTRQPPEPTGNFKSPNSNPRRETHHALPLLRRNQGPIRSDHHAQ